MGRGYWSNRERVQVAIAMVVGWLLAWTEYTQFSSSSTSLGLKRGFILLYLQWHFHHHSYSTRESSGDVLAWSFRGLIFTLNFIGGVQLVLFSRAGHLCLSVSLSLYRSVVRPFTKLQASCHFPSLFPSLFFPSVCLSNKSLCNFGSGFHQTKRDSWSVPRICRHIALYCVRPMVS